MHGKLKITLDPSRDIPTESSWGNVYFPSFIHVPFKMLPCVPRTIIEIQSIQAFRIMSFSYWPKNRFFFFFLNTREILYGICLILNLKPRSITIYIYTFITDNLFLCHKYIFCGNIYLLQQHYLYSVQMHFT